MKTFLYLSSVVAVLFTIAAPNARSQSNVSVEAKHLERLTPQGNLVQFVAATIVPQHGDSTPLVRKLGFRISSSRNVIHLEGDVQITIYNRALMLHASTRDELTKELVLTADEADYDVDTGEIQPGGRVSVKFQNVGSPK
jgi:hypothetical protein